jgi:hypothetical protein
MSKAKRVIQMGTQVTGGLGAGLRIDAAFLDPPYNVPIGGHAVSAGSHREFGWPQAR